MKEKLLVFLLLLLPFSLYAQKRQVSGTVKSDNEPLIGVSVVLKGTTLGTATDSEGFYSIDIPEDQRNPVLRFSYLGYESQEIPVNDRNYIPIELKENNVNLDEVVVIAYGVQKKSDLTSSISVVSAEDIAKVPVVSVSEAIQGKVPGVTITNDGSPGSVGSIRIRGIGTVNSTEPLVVVDGIPGASMPDAYNIESFQILKDAAACALYGARGSNGVLLISTKKGVKGKTSVSYNGFMGYQWMHKKLDLLSAEDYIRFHQENYNINNLGGEFSNGWVALSPRVVEDINNPQAMINTDWQDALFRVAPMTKHNVSVSGGGDNNTFFFSGTFVNQDGIQIKSNFESYDLQLNMSAQLGILKVGENLNLYSKRSKNTGPSLVTSQSPLVPIYNANNLGGFDGANDALDMINIINPIADIYMHPDEGKSEGFSGNVFVELNILKELTLRSNFAGNLNYDSGTSKSLAATYGTVNRSKTSMSQSYARYFSRAIENTLTYNKRFSQHNLNVMAGYTREYGLYQSEIGTGDNFTVRIPYSFGTIASDAEKSISGSYSETSMESFLGRIMYDYDGKYLFTGNFRRDGSSKFGTNKRYGNFPSFSLGWRISEESFMQSTKSYLDNLKLRLSWGIIGSDFGVGAYNQEFSLFQSLKYVFNGEVAPASTMASIVNEDLHWEEQATSDIGLDMDFFKGKLSFIADYYYKKTTGMLISVPIASSNGISDVLMNAGDAENKGLELGVIGRKNTGEFRWETTFNVTWEKNKVLKLGNVNQPIIGGITDQFREGITLTQVGQPIGQFFGYKMLGIYQIGDADIPAGLSPGDVRYDDMIDGQSGLSADDRTFLGSPFPDLTYNFGFSGSYKNVDFSVFFQGITGNSIYNNNLYGLEGLKDFHGQGASVKDRWTPNNPSNSIPRATQTTMNNLKISDRFVEDGSYLRLKTLSIGYTIPHKLIEKWMIEKLRIYVSAQNLLTFTNYSGYDPEITNGAGYQWQRDNNLYNGIDRVNYPVTASAFLGIEIQF